MTNNHILIRWWNGLGCEIAQSTAKNVVDAAHELTAMIHDAGGELMVGDKITIEDANTTGE